MTTERNVVDFKIHNLTEEQFQELKAQGKIDPNAIYCTPDETVANFEAVNARIDETNKNLNTVDKKVDDAIQTEQQHNIEINARVDETVANFEEINTEIEALKDKGGFPLLTPIWADHTLNDMSWLNADTFSWQSGDVYVAAYEHLASEAIFESKTKKYVRVKTLNAAHDGWREDNNIYYREPSYDLSDDIVYDEGYAFAWVAASSNMMVITNTETPTESDVIYYRSKIYPEDPPPSEGRVIETGEETLYSNAETETIDGIAITFCRAEDGHKICPAGQEANVQALYEKTGVAWYYILDTENKQFKLPRTKHAFTGLRDEVGKYVPAGLPNITATFAQYTPNVGDLPVAVATGAAYGVRQASVKTYSASIIDSGSDNTQIAIDASRSSSVYGNSNTVQPKSTQMYLYFYVGNFERDALEQTAGITSEQLNNKIDKSEENRLNTAGMVMAFAGTSAPSGWLKCDGSAISRTTYASLFAAIGTKYGTGNGSTTFNLPTQSVLPLGTQANIITIQGEAATTQTYRFLSNNQVAGNGLASIENGISYLSNQAGTEFYLDLGRSSYADLANATGATAIVCIKY